MQRLDGQSDALAAADAQRDQAAFETVTPHRVNEFCREHRARRANRVAVGHRTALDIHNVIGQSEFARDQVAMAAKASLISTRSTDRISQPARSNACLTAGTGPSPNMPGSTAAMP